MCAFICVYLYLACFYSWGTVLCHIVTPRLLCSSRLSRRALRAMLLQYGFLTFCIVCPYSSLCCDSCAFHVVFRAMLLGNSRCSLSAFCTPFYAACFRLSLFHVFCTAFYMTLRVSCVCMTYNAGNSPKSVFNYVEIVI